MIKILFASLKWDFGNDKQDPVLGYSYEYSHVYPAFEQLAQEGLIELDEHWFDLDNNKLGMERLVENAKRGCWDLIFSMPVTHALSIHLPYAQEIIKAGVPIYQFHCDPLRRFGDFVLSSWREGYFTNALIPAPHMLKTYQKEGIPTEIMHFGSFIECNKIVDCEKIYDVSFVGQNHGLRNQVIEELRRNGIKVHWWGHFLPNHPFNHGRCNEEEMNRIFNQSKINLNLTWISQPPYLHQIKGRHTELAAAGAFQIATYGKEEMEGIEEILIPGKDFIQVYTVAEMIQSIKYYLANETECERIADNAYQKRDNLSFYSIIKKWIAKL